MIPFLCLLALSSKRLINLNKISGSTEFFKSIKLYWTLLNIFINFFSY
jgi:hypothetical protein